ncbi:hypothetical protein Tasa_041_015 [Tanticharoenia sakaeratensis NBRC 103193]|uniref:Uncharacterized protein n=1 Tax=Tanticharoenia sakaeratensis NBRC 103193 TaxID=1231623 RepID=A0A0D6MP83_9PROT|nr:hypothetical protein Tasa_041_015 [Tanticharoenia sakaeratensis NBRC 103193]GBQ23278.1 hypothetical protein AA103193_2358 [Tanticharoenia sakaeratensis NBRC 103193]
MSEWEEGENCPCSGCGGTVVISYPKGGCSCHINAPCGRCTSSFLVCDACGEQEPESEVLPNSDLSYRHVGAGVFESYCRKPSKDLGNGRRIFDYDYDSSSGSTMVFRGKYEGPVTGQDIIDALGVGTFGKRGPFLTGDKVSGSFTYTKITD